MVAKNDITGDKLQSKLNTKEYEDNFDKIFGKKKHNLERAESTPNQSVECSKDWDEKRVDIIGSNGNDGLHYADVDAAYQRVERDYEDTSS